MRLLSVSFPAAVLSFAAAAHTGIYPQDMDQPSVISPITVWGETVRGIADIEHAVETAVTRKRRVARAGRSFGSRPEGFVACSPVLFAVIKVEVISTS